MGGLVGWKGWCGLNGVWGGGWEEDGRSGGALVGWSFEGGWTGGGVGLSGGVWVHICA